MKLWAIAAALLATLPAAAQDRPPCREVADPPHIQIDPQAAAQLAQIGLDRTAIFARMRETSIPETMGCWAMPVGNFDSMLISVGMLQWNYGTGSLQPVLTAWRESFNSRRRFKRTLKELAPTYGKLLFSKDCLKTPVRQKCRDGILAAHGEDGKLNATAIAELTAIFDHDAMLQVQTDTYVALLLEVRAELYRLWPTGPITARKVKWAIDTRVQQKTLPGDEDAARLRRKLANVPSGERAAKLKAMLAWYQGLSEAVDQDGVSRDYAWNVAQWTCQALTFSRRAKIILGVGSVSGVRDGGCT